VGSEGAAFPANAGRGVAIAPGATVEVAGDADEFFPDGVARLQALTGAPVTVPTAGPPWRAVATLSEGAKKGLLMGRYPLPKGKSAFFFSLPSIWKEMFDPQSDFAARENVTAYLKAAVTLAGREEGVIRVSRPARPCHLVPFDMDFSGVAPGASANDEVKLLVGGAPKTLKRSGADEHRAEGLSLPAGHYALELRRGGEKLWADSLDVSPKAALELARIGFDPAYLGGLAAQSGGAVIAASDSASVTSTLPNLPAAQARVEKTQAFRLYNTHALFLLLLALLSLSWVLRKRWDLD
jgi:hypothetical protein